MYRIYITLMEVMAAAVFIIPLWMIYHKICFHNWKTNDDLYGICILHDSSFSTGWIPQYNSVKDRGDSKRNSIYLYDTGFCKCLPECIVVYPVWFLFANFMGKIPKCKKNYRGRIVDDPFY